jgi:hypothetical protein
MAFVVRDRRTVMSHARKGGGKTEIEKKSLIYSFVFTMRWKLLSKFSI